MFILALQEQTGEGAYAVTDDDGVTPTDIAGDIVAEGEALTEGVSDGSA